MAPRTAAAAASPLPRALRLCALLLAGSAPLAKASSASASSGSKLSASAASASKASAAGKAQGASGRFWPFDSSSSSLMAVEGTETVEAPIDGAMYDEALPEPAAAPQRQRLQVRRPKARSGPAAPAVPGQGGLVIPDAPMTEPLAASTSDAVLVDPAAAKSAKVVQEYDEDLPEGASKPQALPRQVHHQRPRRAALASTQHGVAAHSKGPGQWDTCLKFAAWVKSQSLQGPEVAAVWLNTCQPAVASGTASKQYVVMCESLGGAIEEFSHNPEWTPKQACTSILRAFRESGVGATPLSP